MIKLKLDRRVHPGGAEHAQWFLGARQAIMSMTDANSHWKVLSPALATGRADECPSGSKIACGAALRLRHVKTGCLLHSHPQFLSPLSHNQEVRTGVEPGGVRAPRSHRRGARAPRVLQRNATFLFPTNAHAGLACAWRRALAGHHPPPAAPPARM